MAYLVGQGPAALPGGYTSQAFSATSGNPGPGFPLRVGTTAKDQDGNVYEFVDYVGTVYGGEAVFIFDDHTAEAINITVKRGRVGIAMTGATSDQGGWALIYGRGYLTLGLSGVSPSDAANGPTTLNTSVATRFVIGTSATSPAALGWTSDPVCGAVGLVEGMWVASDVSLGDVSAVTSATSHTGNQVAVFLNFPYIRCNSTDVS